MWSTRFLNLLLYVLVITSCTSSANVALAFLFGANTSYTQQGRVRASSSTFHRDQLTTTRGGGPTQEFIHPSRLYKHTTSTQISMSAVSLDLGEYTVTLSKPLGIILEESEAGNSSGGVQIASLAEGGAAAQLNSKAMSNGGLTMIVRGDRLVRIGNEKVSTSDFDSVMDILIAAPANEELCLTLSDGLGRMDIAPNLAKKLDPQDAILVDEVVRAAVRQIRGRVSAQGQLGDLLRVEIIIGAGVRTTNEEEGGESRRCQVRFFAIFSRDTVTTFSCSVSATGVKRQNEEEIVDIVGLTCAKDEGWGQTIDLIVEKSK